MTERFDYFVILAEMRTGSNFLETNLNAMPGLHCHGEAFNPHFVGYPNRTEILGINAAARERDPGALISRIREEPGVLSGFRYFHDHDPRVLDRMLDDPRCAKIVLTRNPLDSYVSWKIARATGQWKLTDVKRRKEALPRFDAAEFRSHLDGLQAFQLMVLNRLQVSGQTAFYVDYDDLRSVEVMNGLAAWLGVANRLEALDQSLKPQNPEPVTAKVANPEEMRAALAGIDRFDLGRTPNFEPRRGPAVPQYLAGQNVPLLYMPVKGGPVGAVRAWLSAADAGAEPETGMDQKALRQWKRQRPGHRSFTVVSHPLTRAHRAFCRAILNPGPDQLGPIRRTLRGRYGLPIPEGAPDEGWDRAAHRAAFLAFLGFAKANLAGQTSVRVDGAWCSQSQALQGFALFAPPDAILREEALPAGLAQISQSAGIGECPPPPAPERDLPFALSEIYDDEVEARAVEAWGRDYMMFGYGRWADQAA